MDNWNTPDWEEKIRERLAPLRLNPAREAEMIEELAQHLNDCHKALLSEGAMPEEAYQAALLELEQGDLAELKSRRTVSGIVLEPAPRHGNITRVAAILIHFWLDMRFAIRTLRKQPGFALLAILALALGIGSATVGFGVVENLLVAPYPYKGAGRIVTMTIHDSKAPENQGRSWLLLHEFLDYQQKNHVFDDMVGSYNSQFVYTGHGGAETFLGSYVTSNTFEFFGIPARLGRGITPEDAKPGAPPVFVMNYRIWQERFGGDPAILNTVFVLNDQPRTLVGIMPPRFQAYGTRLWVPITADSVAADSHDPSMTPALWALGRMKPGVSPQNVAADLTLLGKQLSKTYPKNYPPEFVVLVHGLNDFVMGNFKGMLYALMAAVMMLLLIACSNVANLLLARASKRDKEIAVRAAIGASPARLVSQLMAESFALAAAGLIAGCVLAYLGLKVIVATIPQGPLPDEAVIGLNPAVLAVSLGITFLVTCLCGLAPALHAVRGELPSRLASTSRTPVDALRHGKFRAALVIGEVAISLVLLTGAGLMLRSFMALAAVDLGFNPQQIVFAQLFPAKPGSHQLEHQKLFFQQVLERVQAIPGVTSAAETSSVPALSGGGFARIDVPGLTHAENWGALMDFCSEDYFRTLGLQLQRGRVLTKNDVDSASQVAVINHALVAKYFGKIDPLGKRITFVGFDQIPGEPHSPDFEIVGVVSDFKNRELRIPTEPQAFVPYTTSTMGQRNIVVRSAVKPESLLPDLRRAIWAVDSNMALGASGSVEHWLDRTSFSVPHFGSLFLGTFAGAGLSLAAIGIFSVMAYTVSLQTHELGIRMALGAQRGNLLRLMLLKGMRLIAAGVIVGLVASYTLTRFLASQLWGVSANDSRTYVAVVMVMIATGTAACFLPARKATQVDPLIAIRCE